MGGQDETTTKYISGKLGKQTIRSINNSRSYGKQGSYSLSYNKDGRELMTQDELSGMANQNCILFIRGLDPFFCTKYDLKKHPNYKLSGDAKDEYKYNVKEMLHTGKCPGMSPSANAALRLYEEAQLADTQTAAREHRYYSRPVREYTAGGKPCLQMEKFDLMPHFNTPADQLTEQQLQEQQRASQEYTLESIVVPNDDERRAEYERELQHQLMHEFYGTDDEGMEEYRHDETP